MLRPIVPGDVQLTFNIGFTVVFRIINDPEVSSVQEISIRIKERTRLQ